MDLSRPSPTRRPASRSRASLALVLALAMVLALVTAGFFTQPAAAANPPPVQYYYVTLPEDDLLTLFDENQDTLGSYDQVVSPIRSVTSVAINEQNVLVYWDQWEDGGYDADIANPGANVYNATTNPDGTQIWGDGDLTNGCPPALSRAPIRAASRRRPIRARRRHHPGQRRRGQDRRRVRARPVQHRRLQQPERHRELGWKLDGSG